MEHSVAEAHGPVAEIVELRGEVVRVVHVDVRALVANVDVVLEERRPPRRHEYSSPRQCIDERDLASSGVDKRRVVAAQDGRRPVGAEDALGGRPPGGLEDCDGVAARRAVGAHEVFVDEV